MSNVNSSRISTYFWQYDNITLDFRRFKSMETTETY